MPFTNTQLGMAAAAGIAGIYYFMQHQKTKNPLDKASDRFEQGRLGARQQMGDDSYSTAAAKAYYDTKESARKA